MTRPRQARETSPANTLPELRERCPTPHEGGTPRKSPQGVSEVLNSNLASHGKRGRSARSGHRRMSLLVPCLPWKKHQVHRFLGVFEEPLARRAYLRAHRQTLG
jgi:hypothetical protein